MLGRIEQPEAIGQRDGGIDADTGIHLQQVGQFGDDGTLAGQQGIQIKLS